jgi:glycosyltransferase involved in cell wall biosynthesis
VGKQKAQRQYLTGLQPESRTLVETIISKNLELIDHDIVFSPGAVPIACLRTEKPIVIWTDATFGQMVFVLPTQADCVPVVLTEASAYGLPILSTAVGGVSTIGEDKVNGRVFPLTESANRLLRQSVCSAPRQISADIVCRFAPIQEDAELAKHRQIR